METMVEGEEGMLQKKHEMKQVRMATWVKAEQNDEGQEPGR